MGQSECENNIFSSIDTFFSNHYYAYFRFMNKAAMPRIIQATDKRFLWKVKTLEKQVFLTFDDGPIPNVTPWVMDILSAYNARATFFCVGENVDRNRILFNSLLDNGHEVGNHTYSHLNGWKSKRFSYYRDIMRCQELYDFKLFRPPFGKININTINTLKKKFQLVMWDTLSVDYNQQISENTCYNNVVKHAEQGSIIVFHDSLKAEKNLKLVLPKVLEYYSNLAYQFDVLPASSLQTNN